MAVFYGLDALVGFSFLGQAVSAAGIAVVHSVFNVFATLVLLPFSQVLEKLACLTVPPQKAETDAAPEGASPAMRLDERFLQSPALRWNSAVWPHAIWRPAPKRRWALQLGF